MPTEHVSCDNQYVDTIPIPATWFTALRTAVTAPVDVQVTNLREFVDQLSAIDTDHSDINPCPFMGEVEPFYVSRDQSDWDCPLCGHRNHILWGEDD